MDCIFCKIANKEIPAKIVYEDKDVIAFHDLDPKAPHHVLIIPHKHIATLNDASDEDEKLLGRLFLTAKNIAAELGIAEAGYRTLLNCNRAGGQAVYHLHLHLLGGRTMHWPPG